MKPQSMRMCVMLDNVQGWDPESLAQVTGFIQGEIVYIRNNSKQTHYFSHLNES